MARSRAHRRRGRRRPRAASRGVGPVGPTPRWRGLVVLCVLGWLVVLGAAVSLAWVMIPNVWAVTGPTPFTYHDPASYHGPAVSPAPAGWPLGVAIWAPLIGFNLVYWCAPPATRLVQLGWLLALDLIEFACFAAGVVWVTGAGEPAGRVFAPDATDADTVIAFTVVFGACLAACAIMFWLGARSDFEARRAEYFGSGGTVVRLTPLSVPAQACWTVGLFLGWAVLLMTALAPQAWPGRYDGSAATGVRPWPDPSSDPFAAALPWFGLLVGVPFAVSLSLLIENALYTGPWAGRAAASPKNKRVSGFARFVVKLRHWPFAVTWAIVSLGAMTPAAWDETELPTAMITMTAVLVAGLGGNLLFFRWEWQVRNLTAPTMRVHLAGPTIQS